MTVLPVVPAVQAVASPPTATFREVVTHRILDTRANPRSRLAGGSTLEVSVPEAMGAVAVVVSVTVTGTAGPGFLTLYRAGTSRPDVSTLNFDAGSIISNQATVPVDSGGRFTVFAYASTDVVVDLVGTYVPASTSTDGRFIPLTPVRALDTRTGGHQVPAGGSIVVQPHLSGAEAAVVTITVTNTAHAGFVTAHRSDQPPPATSTLNFEAAGTIRAVLATVALAPDGTFRIDASVATDIVVDVLGAFTNTSAPSARSGLYVPLSPTRQFDTRDGDVGRLAAGSSVTISFTDQPLAILGNLTMTHGTQAGFATASPGALSNLDTSTVDTDRPGESIAAAVAVAHRPGAGVTFSTYAAGDLIFDLAGEYVTETGNAEQTTLATLRIGPRATTSPFDGLTTAGLLAGYPDASSTRAAVLTSDGVVHSFGQHDVDLPAASTVKALVLGCTLAGLQDRGADQPDAATAGLLHRMISISDNDATTTLVDALGGTAALRPCAIRFGAAAITINPNGWGVTQIPPESFVSILRNLLRPGGTVLDARWVDVARSLMLSSNIATGERWGIGAGRPVGSTYWVKDGWWTTAPADFRSPGTRINSIGMIEANSDWWIIAIQGDRYSSQQRGITVTELIARTVNHNQMTR
ncbi:MAG: hypothetical protein ABIR68_09515 [Ilumatobacteraceae bacterium]